MRRVPCAVVPGDPLLPPGACPTPLRLTSRAHAPSAALAAPRRSAAGSASGTLDWALQQRSEPLRREGAAIVDDPELGGVLLFGGLDDYGEYLGSTWLFASGHWQQLFPATVPPARYDASIAYDAAHHQVVVFGGATCVDGACNTAATSNDTWIWNGSNWAQAAPTISPPPRWQAGMVYDPLTRLTYLYGGCQDVCGADMPDLWAWDGSSWSLVSADAAPGARAAVQLAFDAAHGVVVLFGGNSPTTSATGDLGDTWTFDGTTWTQLSPATSPEGREGGGMAYDLSRQRVVLFGGYSSQESLYVNAVRQDTWTWDGSTWTRQVAQGTCLLGPSQPDCNEDPGLVYDSTLGKVLLIGGDTFDIPTFLQPYQSGIFINEKETWTLDAGGWTQVRPTWPDDRSQTAFTYDS